MFSAMDDVEDKVEGFQLGIEDYITKPFNFSEVLARIQAVLRQHELTRQMARRESRLRLLESFRTSLQYFTKHVKDPIGDLIGAARSLDVGDREAVQAFAERVIGDSEKVLASIEGLEEEVTELENQDNALRADEVSLDELEQKFRKHLLLGGNKQRGSTP
jgi:DNA-binding response OmpR family regulator